MRRDSKAFRERFLRWKAGEAVYDAGKPIEHYAYGEEGDKIYAPNGKYAITGQLYEDWRQQNLASRAAIEAAAKQPVLRPETRSRSELQRLHTQAAADRQRIREEQLKQKNEEAFWNLVSLTSPSAYIGQAIGQPITGAAALATDAIVLGGAGALKSGVKAAVRDVTKASRNYRLAKAIDKAVTENPTITAYNRNPAIMDAGSLWDYQTYLQQLFPESKIKDILWHGSTLKDLLRFSTNAIGSNTPIKGSTGMYLAPEKTTAANYGRQGGIYPVKLNSKNPYITDQMFALPKNGVNVAKISPKVKNTILRENDAVIAPKRGEITFFDPNDALILGSNEDLQEFRAFMNTTPRGLLSDEPLIARGIDLKDGIGSSSDLLFMSQSAIDFYKNGGLSSLTDGMHAREFENFTGLSPAQFKLHWLSKLGNIPNSYALRFLNRELESVLKRALETLDDIKSARSFGYYNLDDRLKPAQERMADLFDSKEYRSRWPAYSSRPDELIKNIERVAGSVLKRHLIELNDGPIIIPRRVNAGGVYSPTKHKIQVLEQNLDSFTPEHEFSHASDLGEDIEDIIYNKMTPKKSTGDNYDYYNKRSEKRARVMAALADMRARGYNINSYNDILDYLLFNNGFGNHNVKSLFDNYDFKIQDLLDIFRWGKSIIPPVIGVGAITKITE